MAGRTKSRMGGRPFSVVGEERYRQMAGQLHRHRGAIHADTALSLDERASLIRALDTLLSVLEDIARPPASKSSSLTG